MASSNANRTATSGFYGTGEFNGDNGFFSVAARHSEADEFLLDARFVQKVSRRLIAFSCLASGVDIRLVRRYDLMRGAIGSRVVGSANAGAAAISDTIASPQYLITKADKPWNRCPVPRQQ